MKLSLKTTFTAIALLAVMLMPKYSFAEFLSVDDYIKKVETNNPQIKQIEYATAGIIKQLQQVYGVYSAKLNADLSYNNNATRSILQSDPTWPFQGIYTNNVAFNISVAKEFDTGTKLTIGYGANETYYNLRDFGNYYYGGMSPYIALEQSLWKNFNGAVNENNVAAAKANAKSLIYLQVYQKQQIEIQAMKTYFSLAYARTVKDFRAGSLTRTKKILDWNKKRYDSDLAEKVDLLQAQAAYKNRELTLKIAEADVKKYSRSFNDFINVSSEIVEYEIESIEKLENYLSTISDITKNGKRADTLSAIEEVEYNKYTKESSIKNIGAELKLVGKYGLNAVDYKWADSFKQLDMDKYSSFMLGLNYSLPLDFTRRKELSEGYEYQINSAQQKLAEAELNEKNSWDQLLQDWEYAKQEYQLAKDVLSIQSERNKEEQALLKKGRITTYQELNGEQDLDDAILTVYQRAVNLLFVYVEGRILYNTKIITLE